MPRTFKCVDKERMQCNTCKYYNAESGSDEFREHCAPCLDVISNCPMYNANGNCNTCYWEENK